MIYRLNIIYILLNYFRFLQFHSFEKKKPKKKQTNMVTTEVKFPKQKRNSRKPGICLTRSILSGPRFLRNFVLSWSRNWMEANDLVFGGNFTTPWKYKTCKWGNLHSKPTKILAYITCLHNPTIQNI